MRSTFKKAVAGLIVLALLSFTSNAQTSKFSISINSLTTNFNYGKDNSNIQSYKKNYKGFQAGLSYQAGITRGFSIVPELNFSIKGGVLKQNNPLTINRSTLRFHTFEIPVLARLHLKNLYLNAGPYTSYAVSGRMKINGTEAIPATSAKVSFGRSGDFRRWDAGLLAGAGYNFNMKKSVLTLDVRYGYGLINISKNNALYNRVLNISVVVSKPNRKA